MKNFIQEIKDNSRQEKLLILESSKTQRMMEAFLNLSFCDLQQHIDLLILMIRKTTLTLLRMVMELTLRIRLQERR